MKRFDMDSISKLRKENKDLKDIIRLKDNSIDNLQFQLDKILNTRRWLISSSLSQIYHRLFDILRPNTNMLSSAMFNPYEYIRLLKNIPVVVTSSLYTSENIKVSFSVACTIFNESKDILNFLKSVERQTLKPNEIVFVDGGSSDNTLEKLEHFIGHSNLNIRLISKPGYNIPKGRNEAIINCRNEIIVLVDAGTRLHKDYFKNLIYTHIESPEGDLVGGIYQPMEKSEFSSRFIPDWNKVDWKFFLPSTRSLLIKKSLALSAGLYPEYLQTGDDTLFDINYRRISTKWIFNRNAIVYWDCPHSRSQSKTLAYNYGYGQGRNGLGDFTYYPYNKNDHNNDSFYHGFLEGREDRAKLEIFSRNIKGLVIVFASLPINDNSEFVKLLLVKYLISQNYKVVYVSCFSRIHPDSYSKFLDLDYTLLELYEINTFDIANLLNRYAKFTDLNIYALLDIDHERCSNARSIIMDNPKIQYFINYIHFVFTLFLSSRLIKPVL